jgi:hypothetical protein
VLLIVRVIPIHFLDARRKRLAERMMEVATAGAKEEEKVNINEPRRRGCDKGSWTMRSIG